MAIDSKLNYLQETKNQIKDAIIQKGVGVLDTDSFRSYANKIRQIEGGGSSTGGDWQPEPDWWDIETILENDTEEAEQKAIILLTDCLDDGSTNNVIQGFEKYKLSDGQVIEDLISTQQLDLTNLFDTSKDKVCGKGYKTRYIIAYYNSKDVRLNNMVIPNNSIYAIFSGVNFSSTPFSSKRYLEGIKFINNTKFSRNTMNNTFNGCYSLQRILEIDTSNVNEMSGMFNNCYSLQQIPEMDTSNVTTMSNMFSNCYSLQQIPEMNTSNVTNMSSMFYNCCSLQKISEMDTSNVTAMSNMFYGCCSLQEIPEIDTSNVASMGYMFHSCYSLQQIPKIDTSNVTNMNSMFNRCYSLQKISEMDTSNVTSIGYMFTNCYSLFNIANINRIVELLDYSSSSYLNHTSLLRILNALVDLTGQTTQTLTLGTTNLSKLSDEEKAIATEKNWTLA